MTEAISAVVARTAEREAGQRDDDEAVEAAGALLRTELARLSAGEGAEEPPEGVGGAAGASDLEDVGVAQAIREDLIQESPDAERAAGRAEEGASELFGG